MEKTQKLIYSEIEEYARLLHLPAIKRNFIELSKESSLKDLSYEKYLHSLLETEHELRLENAKQSKIRQAHFPFKKYLEDLNVAELPEDAQRKLKVIKMLDFIKEGQNLILWGNSGTGKTHIAIGLGIKACLEGYKVLFTTIPLLINQLKESRSNQVLRRLESQFLRYDLVIADELGYISFDKEGSELLFTHLSLRAGRKSTIITTNLSFERWNEIFQDPVMTAAMVDRLTHKAYMIDMLGDSYRLKETKEWIEKNTF